MPAKNFARKPGSIRAVKPLAKQVAEFIQAGNLSASELARRCGVSRQNVDNVLSGSVTSPRWIAALAREMGTTTDALLTGKAPPPRLVVRAATWPFEFLTPEQWAKLKPSERAVVDHAAAKAAAEFLTGGNPGASRLTAS